MASHRAVLGRFLAALAIILLSVAIVPAAYAQSCPPECVVEPPNVVISPRSNPSPNQSSVQVTVTISDDKPLPVTNPSSSGSFVTWHSSQWHPDLVSVVFTGTVSLSSGSNSFVVTFTDSDNHTSKDSVVFDYTPLPSQPSEAKAIVSQAPHSSTVRSIGCSGCLYGSAAYSTPAYVSRDIPRSVTLAYSSAAAEGRGLVQLDATVNTSTTPSYVSMRLLDSTASAVNLTNGGTASWYTGATGTIRIGAQFSPGLATGVYPFTAGVTTHWGSSYDTTVAVRVFIANESQSPLGAGWSIAGLERLLFRGTSVALYDGSAGFTFYNWTGSAFASDSGAFGALTESSGVYTLTGSDGSWKRFNSSGRMTASGNRFSDSTYYTYSGALLTSIVDEVGKTTTFTYAPNAACPGGSTSGTLCAITDPGGRVSKFVVNGSNDLVTIYDPAGTTVFSGTYSSHRLTSAVDRLGATTSLYYDSFGALDSVRAQSVTTTTTGGSTATESPLMVFRSIEEAVLGASNSSSGSAITPVVADSALVKVTAPNGTLTTMWLNGIGEPIRLRVVPVTGPVQSTVTDYDVNYLPTTVISSPLGGTTRYGWLADTLASVTDAAGTATGYFTRDYLLIDSVQVNGVTVERNVYTGSGALQKLASSTRAGVQTQYQWDAYGRLTQDSTRGQKTTYSYVGSGYQNRDRVSWFGGGSYVAYTHDALGRDSIVASMTDAGLTTLASSTFTYDLLNRVTGATQVGPATTTPSVSENTNAHTATVSVTDPRSLVFSSVSNALGWTTAITDPHSNSTSHGYDRNGLLRRSVNRASGVVTMSYDSLARPVAIVANGDTTAFSYSSAATWTVGKTAAARDSVNVDAIGRPMTVTSVRSGMTWTMTNAYDTKGSRKTLKISDGLNVDTLRFSLNAFNFPEHLPDFAGKWTKTYRHPTTGLLDTIRYPTTSSASTHLRQLPSGYNYHARPTAVHVKAGSSTRQHWRYHYDATGRLTRVDSTLDTEREYWSRYFTYDARGRLYSYRDMHYYITDSIPEYCPGDEENPCSWDYVWDETEHQAVTYAPDYSGNRTDGSASYTNDRLTSMTGADGVAYSFTYDNEGRRLSKTASGYSQTYGWNDLGQLIWVKTNGDSIAYGYDAAGRRVRKHFATTTHYLWDGDNLVMEFNGSLGIVRKYAYHPGVDRPVAVTIGSSTYYYVLDEEGNVRGLWNSSNTEVEDYTYDPYGYLQSSSGSLNNRLRWKGREFESETGLYYMRARWYDPVVGRFISEDPIGLAGGINPYVFADGEPVNRADPSGLECVQWSDEFREIQIDGGTRYVRKCALLQLDPMVTTARGGNDVWDDFDAWLEQLWGSTPQTLGSLANEPGRADFTNQALSLGRVPPTKGKVGNFNIDIRKADVFLSLDCGGRPIVGARGSVLVDHRWRPEVVFTRGALNLGTASLARRDTCVSSAYHSGRQATSRTRNGDYSPGR